MIERVIERKKERKKDKNTVYDAIKIVATAIEYNRSN